MNKILIAALALGVLSTGAMAERSTDLRDMSTYQGKYATPNPGKINIVAANTEGMVVPASDTGHLTAYQRQIMNATNGEKNHG